MHTPALPEEAPCGPGAFRALVESRRSVRRFEPDPIPEEVVRDCLELAILAPNSSNLQPWEFFWVRNTDVKAKLAEACFSQKAAQTASDLVVVAARTRTWRRHAALVLQNWPEEKVPPIVRAYYTRVCQLLYSVGPLSLFGLAKRAAACFTGMARPVPRSVFSKCQLRLWAVKSTALAAENFMLALRAHGYDSCPMEGFDAVRVRRLLKVPRDAEILMVIAAGRRAPNGIYNPRLRFPLDQCLRRF